MRRCLLCQKCEADKTGSHIIPSFLMKRINGDGKRDHEKGFQIKNGFSEIYFGRDIYEEQRRSITDNEDKISSTENYDVKDFIFCKKCEELFASLESKYAPSLNLKFSEDAVTKNTKTSPSDALLFWCSLVWRISQTEHLGNRLTTDLEERLRLALVTNSIDKLNIKYALFRCKDYSKQDGFGTCACMDVKDNYVLLFVDEFMLLMAFDMNEGNHETVLFNIGLKVKEDSWNDGNKIEEIASIPFAIFTKILYSLMCVLVKSMDIPGRFKELHKMLFQDKIPQDILTECLNMLQSTDKIGDKYSIENYVRCYCHILIKHGIIQESDDGLYSISN